MAAPSRPYDTPPVLVRRDDSGMAATSIVVEGKNEENRDMNLGRGATRFQQPNTNMNQAWERPQQIPSSRSLHSKMARQGLPPSRFTQSSAPAVRSPANVQGTTFEALSAPSLSENVSSPPSFESAASTVVPTPTLQTDANTKNGTIATQAASSPALALLADSGAKIENEALPGINQGDPSLDTVPGKNQGDPQLLTTPGATPGATPLANSGSSMVPSSTPAMTVGKPMPGKNQPKPTVDAAALSLMVPKSFSSTVAPTPSSIPSSTTSTSIGTPSASSTGPLSLPSTLAISTPSPAQSSSTTNSSEMSAVLTFVTVTRTAEGKGGAQASTQTIMVPQAVTAPQSLPASFSTLSLTAASTIPSSLATAVSVEPQSGLTPLARTLFILFGVLGFVAILLAFSIIWIMRSNKRRAQAAQQQQQGTQFSFQEDEKHAGYGTTSRLSGNSSIKTFLTASEKAIVNRAATPDGEPDASTRPSNALTEAINSFITKSRRLTYKISP